MDFLETKHWIILVAGLLVVMKIIRRILNPPKELQWSDVPEAIRQAVEESFPGFAAQSQRDLQRLRKHVFHGTYQGHPGRVEVECGPEGRILEIEFDERMGLKTVARKHPCDFSEFPAGVVAHLRQLLGSEFEQFQPSRSERGESKAGLVYKVRGLTPSWKWEVEMTADGRLLELEKESRI